MGLTLGSRKPVVFDMGRGNSNDDGSYKTRNGRLLKYDSIDDPVVVAFDPGGITGWSVMMVEKDCLIDPKVKILSSIKHWAHGQIDCGAHMGGGPAGGNGLANGISDGESRGVHEMLKLVSMWTGGNGIAVVIEDFIIRQYNMSREFLAPVRVTAGVEYGLWLNGLCAGGSGVGGVLKQSPSEAKSTATDERLKDWGLYERDGGMQHARDADRHAITFLRKAKGSGSRSMATKGERLRQTLWPGLYG